MQRLQMAENDSATWLALFDLSQLFAQSNVDSAILIAKQSLELAEEKLPGHLPRSLNNVGLQYMNKGEFDNATEYYFRALEAAKKQDCITCSATTLGNVGIIFWKKKDLVKAEQYFKMALEELEVAKDSQAIIRTLNNLGLVYTEKQQLDKAEAVYNQAVVLLDNMKSTYALGMIYNNLGNISYQRGNYAGAMDFYQKSAVTSEKSGDNQSRFLGILNAGWASLAMNDAAKAIGFFDRAERLATELKNDDQRQSAYGSKADAYKALGDFEKAFAYLERYTLLKDTIGASLNSRQIAELETKYQTQQKEAQLAKQQLEIQHQTNIRNITLAVTAAVLLALFGLFQYFRSRQKIRQKEAELAAEKAEAAAQLERVESEKLREMNQVKSTFFANISHEFRTPLTLIISPLEQMIGGSFQGDFQKYYRIMHRNGKRLLDLVNQLLDLSKLESGKLNLELKEGDLGKFASAIAWSFESLALQQQVALKVEVPEGPSLCFFDPDKVEKILVNLLSNALKFTGEGGQVELRLTIDDLPVPHNGGTSPKSQSLIVIRDTGIGIPTAQMAHLFERFYHTKQSEVQAGSGLGLALTKELVELHGGTIEAKSEEGRGTEFRVTLEIGDLRFMNNNLIMQHEQAVPKQIIEGIAPIQHPKSIAEKPVIIPHSSVETPILLIAEDNADVREYVKEQFKNKYQVIEAENGKAGMEKAIEQMPDLVITDVMMPEMDGTEFCKQLKTNEKTSHIPVIMLTARAEQADRLEGLETGADDYLVKPFDAKELQVRVANLIEQRRKLQEHFSRTLTHFTPSKVEAESMDAAFLRRIRKAVEENLDDETFSVVELGSKVSMSRSQLHRKLSALTGFSPNQVIRNMRLERAKQLLQAKAGNASEVAFMCGFNSSAYFSKCFKDYFGMTPSEL